MIIGNLIFSLKASLKVISVAALVATFTYSANAQRYKSADQLGYQRLKDYVDRLQADLTDLQKQVYNKSSDDLSASQQINWSRWNKRDDAQAPKLYSILVRLEEKIRDLSGVIEEKDFMIEQISRKVDKSMQDMDFRIQDVEKSLIEVNKSLKESIANQSAIQENAYTSSKAPRNDYQEALTLIKNYQYKRAESLLKNFISDNRNSPLQGSAHYWLGETFYARGNYAQASVYFLKGYQGYPKSNKVHDNLLKLAMSLGQMGKIKESCTTFNKLLTERPAPSPSIQQIARKERSVFGCQ